VKKSRVSLLVRDHSQVPKYRDAHAKGGQWRSHRKSQISVASLG